MFPYCPLALFFPFISVEWILLERKGKVNYKKHQDFKAKMEQGKRIRNSGISVLTVHRKLKWQFSFKIFDFYLIKSYRGGLLEVFLKKTVSKLLEYFKKNIHYGQWLKLWIYNVTKVAPSRGHLIEFLKGFNKNNFQYKKCLWRARFSSLQMTQILQKWECDFFFLIIVTKVQLLRNLHLSKLFVGR